MKSYRHDIDGLRAIAVLAVVVFHIAEPRASGGFVGVDIFFTISGFLIAQIVWSDLNVQKFSFVEFYAKRIKRLFPALFVMIFATAIGAYMTGLAEDIKRFAYAGLSSIFYVSNFYFLSLSGYFDKEVSLNPLFHTWSLSVEEQFYFILPPLLYLIFKVSKNNLVLVLSVVAIFSLMLSELLLTHYPSVSFYMSPSRFWQFLAGSLIAFIPRNRLPAEKIMQWLGWIGFLILLGCIFDYHSYTRFPGIYAIPPTLGTVLVILAAANQQGRLYKFLTLPLMTFYGKISYSLYLWHVPVIVIYKFGVEAYISSLMAWVLFAISTLLAYLSWRFIESPFRAYDFRTQKKQIYGYSMVATLFISAICAYFIVTDGVSHKFSERSRYYSSFLDYDNDQYSLKGICHSVSLEQADNCIVTDPVKKNVLLLGDSHMAHFSMAFRELYPDVSFSQATSGGCRPVVPQGAGKDCQELMDRTLQHHIQHNKFDAVIIAGRWKKKEVARLAESLDIIQAHVPRIIILGPSIRYTIRPPRYLALNYADENLNQKFMALSEFEAMKDIEKTFEEMLSGKSIEYVSVLDVICMEDGCIPLTEDDVPLQFDSAHFTHEGAIFVLEKLKSKGFVL